MQRINEVLKKYALKPHRYEKKGKTMLVDTEEGRFIIKEKRNNQKKIYQYLDSRNFSYYPKIINEGIDDYEITEYQEEVEIPEEQKILDLIDLVALLHNKTTHYKEVDEADYKKIYEDISNNILYLTSYYNDLIEVVETRVFMSPSEYLFARNISQVYEALSYCKAELENWYQLIKDKRKQRLVVLHNNLQLDHFIRNKNAYFISWDKSKIDLPIFDLYKLYLKHGLDFDFSDILHRYEHSYPLLEEERKLLFILIAMPNKIEFDQTEYEMCQIISNQMDFLWKTERLISPYYASKTEQQ